MGKEEKKINRRKHSVHQFEISFFFFFEQLDRAKLRAISHYEIKAKMAFLDFGIIIKCLILEIESYHFPSF